MSTIILFITLIAIIAIFAVFFACYQSQQRARELQAAAAQVRKGQPGESRNLGYVHVRHLQTSSATSRAVMPVPGCAIRPQSGLQALLWNISMHLVPVVVQHTTLACLAHLRDVLSLCRNKPATHDMQQSYSPGPPTHHRAPHKAPTACQTECTARCQHRLQSSITYPA